MPTFKELCNGKPSAAIRAMVEGLKNIPKEGVFEVNMQTFGSVENKVCFGCAATCCIQQLSNKRFTPDGIHWSWGRASEIIGVNPYSIADGGHREQICDIEDFELAINDLRMGNPSELFTYFGYDAKQVLPEFYEKYKQTNGEEIDLPTLRTGDYLENLEPYSDFANFLDSIGY